MKPLNSKDSEFVKMNSIISLKLVNDTNSLRNQFLVMRAENLEESIIFRKCNVESDIIYIKESLFIVRPVSNDPLQDKKHTDSSLKYSTSFLLQHLSSKKYLSLKKTTSSKSYSVGLQHHTQDSVPTIFAFKKVVEQGSVQDKILFNEIIFLCAYIKDKAQYYFLNSKEEPTDDHVLEAELTANSNQKISVVNQSHFNFDDDRSIYSGDILNINFNVEQNENVYFLGIQTPDKSESNWYVLKEEVKENLDIYLDDKAMEEEKKLKTDNMKYKKEKINMNELRVSPVFNSKNEYYNHVNFNTFWIIEKVDDSKIKEPVLTGDRVRIKNVLLNVYLAIDKKEDRLKLVLVPENELYIRDIYVANFMVQLYGLNDSREKLQDCSKIILKGIFGNIQELYNEKNEDRNLLFNMNKEFKRISLEIEDSSLVVKENREFIFELKKISIDKGNESIYLKNIINQLNFMFADSRSSKDQTSNNLTESIGKNLKFFCSYLLNLNDSFINKAYDTFYPVELRQNLFMNYSILKTISKIILVYSSSSKINSFQREPNEASSFYDQISSLMKIILKFMVYISRRNVLVKKEIFSLCLEEIYNISKKIFGSQPNYFLYFNFKLFEECPEIQDGLLNCSGREKSQVKFKYINILDYAIRSSEASEKNAIVTEKMVVPLSKQIILEEMNKSNYLFHFLQKLAKFRTDTKNKLSVYQEIKEMLSQSEVYFQMLEEALKRMKADSTLYRMFGEIITIVSQFDRMYLFFSKEYNYDVLVSSDTDKEEEKNRKAMEADQLNSSENREKGILNKNMDEKSEEQEDFKIEMKDMFEFCLEGKNDFSAFLSSFGD